MRWRQAILAATIAITIAIVAYLRLEASLLVATLVGAAVYISARTLIATLFRTRYWLARGTKGSYTRHCPDCGQRIYRKRGDWIMHCYRCSWTAGPPGLRWLTHSVPSRQLRRSISWTGLGVIAVAAAAIVVAPAFGALPADAGVSASTGGTANPASDPATERSTATATPAVGDEYQGDPDLQAVESETISRINKIRQQRGLSPLEQSNGLTEMAQYHSNDEARNGYYAHTAPDGESVEDRFDRFAPRCMGGSENIHKGEITYSYGVYGSQETVNTRTVSGMSEYLVQGWMNSEGHRENILNSGWRRVGIGIGVTPDGTFYATINFC